MSDTAATEPARKFLVVVDNTTEMRAALRFACRRAKHTGGTVALFYAVPKTELHHFATIGDLMDREARSDAEKLLQHLAAETRRETGRFPSFYIREGDVLAQLVEVVKSDPSFSVLVLAAKAGNEGPGPIVSALSGKLAGKIRIPVTIVPGTISDEKLDALT
ncbi:MAG: universal stress protein [Rhodobacteraceae bacterium]|nr:universal stress protein [Paracoccaceae bacterium]